MEQSYVGIDVCKKRLEVIMREAISPPFSSMWLTRRAAVRAWSIN